MLIVDAQVHIWSGGTPLGAHRQVSNYSADELLREMDEAGVDAALIHPPGWDPHSHEVAVEAARAHPDRFAILGYLPLDRAESRTAIDSWTNQPGVLGLRYALVRPEQRTWHEDGTMDWLWPAAERAGLPVALMATRFFPLLAQIAGRHPGLRLIVDHLGYVSGGKDDAAFGSDRFFWGTDITRMPRSYRQCVTMFTEELPWLKGHDLERVMGQAVCDWIGWQRL